MCPEAVSLLEGSCLKEAALSLEPDVLHTLDSLYAFYHRQWWCYSHMCLHNVCQVLDRALNLRTRHSVRGGQFLIKMQTFDDTITEFSLAISDRCMQGYHRRFNYVSLEDLSSADGCSRPPTLNASHGPLKDDAQPSDVQ